MLKYLLTYKLSQDHLELFFGAIGSRGGFNNNPTSRQFEAAYKRLLIQSEISAGNRGNAISLEEISILACSSGFNRNEDNENLEECEKSKEIEEHIHKAISENNYLNSSVWDITLYVEDVVSYIAGFVVKAIKTYLACLTSQSLIEDEETHSLLQQQKTYGRLVKASKLVINVCKIAEKFFRFFNKRTGIFSIKKNLIALLINGTLQILPASIYDIFGDHLFDDDPLNNHCHFLITLILKNRIKSNHVS